MKSRIAQLLVMALAVVLVGALPAFADGVIYGSANNNNLYSINPTTGVATLIGSMGQVMTDIAINGSNQMFAIGPLANGNTNLYSINLANGAPTTIGSNNNFLNALGFGSGGTLYAAGGDPVQGGTLFGTVNTGTGAFTSIHNNPGNNSSGDLAFAFLNGVMYASTFGAIHGTSSDQLWTVNLATGVETFVGNIGKPNVFGLAVLGGVLYGLDNAGDLLTINPTTGVGTVVANNAIGWTGATSAPDQVVRTPEPGGLLLLGSGMLALAGVLRRRF